MAQEIELKLITDAKGAATLAASGLFASRLRAERLEATYFDTAAQALRRNGVSLRVRRKGGQLVQTVKADGPPAVGVFDRGEWEMPLRGPGPVDDPRTPVDDLVDGGVAVLAPQFGTLVDRRLWREGDGAAEIEVVLDDALIAAGERSTRFHEIELELLRGEPAALFALARRIDAVAPVRLGVLSKAERGYRLREALDPGERAGAVHLNNGMDLPAAMGAIAASCLRQYRLNEDRLLDRMAPEAVHQARVGLRRLRAGLALFREVLGRAETARFAARLRALAGALGQVRDLDVLVEGLPAGPLRDRIAAQLPPARAAMLRTLRARRSRTLTLDLSEWLLLGSWRSDPDTAELRGLPIGIFAAQGLDHLLARLRKRARHLHGPDDEPRHRLRKDAKKLRYAAEFFGSLFVTQGQRRRHARFTRALARLQDDLGGLNDRANAEARLRLAGLAGSDEADAYLAAWDAEALLDGAGRHLDRLLDCRPFWT